LPAVDGEVAVLPRGRSKSSRRRKIHGGEEPGRVDDCGEEGESRTAGKKGSNLKGGGERHRRDGTARSMAARSGVGRMRYQSGGEGEGERCAISLSSYRLGRATVFWVGTCRETPYIDDSIG
jgi:hypothetical protein